ncbi:exosome complex exonuclease RRP44 [Trichinella spiralis]|uniref:exosome complex exonuclease RRP44 n=1 Tax=Trichinella spiralis TaxID=6334 RepID=UPI0001EFD176|nr:exosome complex exonuclease RRP44 [Trichinella spiralis]
MPLVRERQFVLAKKQYLVKLRRDRYLRDDISCGIVDCKLCSDVWNLHLINLGKVPLSPSKVVDARHILFLDTNIIRHQVDVLTDERFGSTCIVRNSEESIDERNDRAIRHAAMWY